MVSNQSTALTPLKCNPRKVCCVEHFSSCMQAWMVCGRSPGPKVHISRWQDISLKLDHSIPLRADATRSTLVLEWLGPIMTPVDISILMKWLLTVLSVMEWPMPKDGGRKQHSSCSGLSWLERICSKHLLARSVARSQWHTSPPYLDEWCWTTFLVLWWWTCFCFCW